MNMEATKMKSTKRRASASKRKSSERRRTIHSQFDDIHFKPPITRWPGVITAFQAPVDPRYDSVVFGISGGEIIEHSSIGDLRVLVARGKDSGHRSQILRKKIRTLEAQIDDLKAANELLRRLREEGENPRLRLLSKLRHKSSEFALRSLAKNAELPIEKIATDSGVLGLLIELENNGFVTLTNSIIKVTELGNDFLQKKLRLNTPDVA
jgi:hypothetical protein